MRQTGQILIAAVGRIKKSEWRSAQDDYLKRLNRYADVSLTEVKDAVGRGFPDEVALQREGESLIGASSGARRRILLTPKGSELDSEQFAAYVARQLEIFGHLAFLVGGPQGFAHEVEESVEDRLSLSRLTFPHELARILFLEQLYRAFTILRGESYHK